MTTAKALRATDHIVRMDAVLSAEMNGELVLLDPVGAVYVGLDAVGSEIWRRLEEAQQVDQLLDEICGHFDGERAVIAREATAFLETLWARQLVRVEPGASAAGS